ncbi:MAG: hypothetical protein ACW99Q_11005, partial [Candidatus Kariarchaeaceae archaeon]
MTNLVYLLLFSLSLLISGNSTSAHMVSDGEEVTLDFSPESVSTSISSRTARLNESRQWVNLTKIEDSFIFDPILINFQIYNDTRDWRNRTYFDDRGIEIDLITTYKVGKNGSLIQFFSNSRVVPQYFTDRVDFTTFVDPSVDLEIFGMYNNQTRVQRLRSDPLHHIDVSFQISFVQLGFLVNEFDVRIDYYVRSMAAGIVGVEQFHGAVTGFVTMVPVMMEINRYDWVSHRRFYIPIPLALTAKFFDRLLESHGLTSQPKLKLVLRLVVVGRDRSLGEDGTLRDEGDVDVYHQGTRLKRRQSSNS